MRKTVRIQMEVVVVWQGKTAKKKEDADISKKRLSKFMTAELRSAMADVFEEKLNERTIK